MALDANEDLHPLYRTTGEPSMAGGEADMAANTGMTFWTSPIEAEHTKSTYSR